MKARLLLIRYRRWKAYRETPAGSIPAGSASRAGIGTSPHIQTSSLPTHTISTCKLQLHRVHDPSNDTAGCQLVCREALQRMIKRNVHLH